MNGIGALFLQLEEEYRWSVFLIGNSVGVYLNQEMKCMKTKCSGQIAEEQREEWFAVHVEFLRQSEESKLEQFFAQRAIFFEHGLFKAYN